MENTNMDRELVKIENLQEHIYQLLLPHAHSIRKDTSRPHFPEPLFLLTLASSLAISFIIAPVQAAWRPIWEKLLGTKDHSIEAIQELRKEVETLRRTVESNKQKWQELTKEDIVEAMKRSLRTHSTLPAETIYMIADDIGIYVERLHKEP